MSAFTHYLLKSAQRTLVTSAAAGLLSSAMLVYRSRTDTGRYAAALNAPSHWIWGQRALRKDSATLAHTAVGAAVHQGATIFWAALFEYLQSRHARRTPVNAVVDAALVTTAAAVVDLKLVPESLSPGFERRLSGRSLTMVYGTLAIGLAVGGMLAGRRR